MLLLLVPVAQCFNAVVSLSDEDKMEDVFIHSELYRTNKLPV